MKKKIIQLLILLSLSFNIAHASVIAIEDAHEECHHQDALSYVMEQQASDNCGDLCDFHHLFHFMAIVVSYDLFLSSPYKVYRSSYITDHQMQTSLESAFKPPIV